MTLIDSYINVSPDSLKSLKRAGYGSVKFVVSPASSWPGPGPWVAPLAEAPAEFQRVYLEGLRRLVES